MQMSILAFLFWVQIYLATDFKSGRVCGRKSSVGRLIKTKSGKMFLQQSENSTKKDIQQNDYHYHQVKILLLTFIEDTDESQDGD